tara:strand:+ start:1435 stop:2568 length:1134 start_codon:yes stop_codon:yes gene_type:complete
MAYTTIDDGSVYFQTALWSGDNATTQDITNDGNSDLQPDWVWVKCRNTGGNGFSHNVHDTSRGVDNNVNKSLAPDDNDKEGLGNNVTSSAQFGGVSAMLSDGFTVREGSIDNDARYVNESSRTYVGWQWKVNGGTTASNSNGSITSTVQVNTVAGISIILYTATGSNATIGHGLSQTPEVVITKGRSDNHSWIVAHKSDSADFSKVFVLNTNAASVTSTGNYQGVAPTSTVYSIGTSGGNNSTGGGGLYVAYAFHSVQGYSKFGSYTGNGNADGTFVYTGFKPAWIMAKRTDAAKNWYIADSTRSPNNVNKAHLVANTSDAEDTSGDANDSYFDILSNGFKLRQDFSHLNASGAEHIYMAFAEHPFVSSKGVPVTAR